MAEQILRINYQMHLRNLRGIIYRVSGGREYFDNYIISRFHFRRDSPTSGDSFAIIFTPEIFLANYPRLKYN